MVDQLIKNYEESPNLYEQKIIFKAIKGILDHNRDKFWKFPSLFTSFTDFLKSEVPE